MDHQAAVAALLNIIALPRGGIGIVEEIAVAVADDLFQEVLLGSSRVPKNTKKAMDEWNGVHGRLLLGANAC